MSRVACRLRVRVLVRLSHPRPPDHNQHGCTVGVLPGPTRVLPMPRQCGIGRRAPIRAVLSCAASWCLVVRRPRRRVDCLILTFCYVSSCTVTEESSVFMGKNHLNKCHAIANTKDLILEQVFDTSTRLVSEQEEIFGSETIGWENHSWTFFDW